MTVKAKLNGVSHDFLVDTGAALSVFPTNLVTHRALNTMTPTAVSLRTATGSNIPVRGRLHYNVAICGLRREFPWHFIVADVTNPLLGFDFLSHHNLLVDCKRRRICDPSTSLSTEPLQTSTETSLQNVTLSVDISSSIPTNAHDLINTYADLFCWNDTLPTVQPPKHDTVHRIVCTDPRPISSKSRPLHPEKLAYAKQEIQELVDAGYLVPSCSEWSSPIHMVPKKTEGKSKKKWRIVGDYRRLNLVTKPDNYPLPHIQHFTRYLHDSKVFSCLDLVRAYHSIPMAKEDQAKTAITTPCGLYEYTHMSFGLKNAAQSFQRFMDSLLRGMDYAFSYLDDVLIFSKSEEEHTRHLSAVLDRMKQYGLHINLNKCRFFVTELDFLGHHVTSKGVSPTNAKIDILANWEVPKDARELQRYLGCIGFYRRFIPQFALHAAPLQELLTQCLNKSSSYKWNSIHQASFDKLKELLSSGIQLHHPDPNCVTYHLVCDASSTCVGGALHQKSENGDMVPLGMFSKKLTRTQSRYSTFDRELLAAYLSVLHFRELIEGRHTTLFTDHKPLMQTLQNAKEGHSDRNQRYLSIVSEYITDVQYVRGEENVVADALSRLSNVETINEHDTAHPLCAIAADFPVDLPSIVTEQQNEQLEEKENLKFYKFGDEHQLLCEISLPYPRPYIPILLRPHVIEHSHNLGHFGFRKTFHFIAERYWWPGFKKEVKYYCRACQDCQRNKISRHTKAPIQSFDLPSSRFTAVHIDIIGPLSSPDTSYSYDITNPRYVLTMIDRSTGWIEAAPLLSITSKEVATAFISTWVPRFGVPLHVITDRGKQFESEFFSAVSKAVGFHRLRTCAYRPQCNGKVERAHRTMKTILKIKKSNWLNDLPVVLLAMHVAPDSEGISPFERVTGEKLMIPHVLTHEIPTADSIRSKVSDFLQPQNHHKVSVYVPKALHTCEYVWIRVDRVRRPLEAPYNGPFKVIRRNEKYFTVQLSDTVSENVSIDRLKPVVLNPIPQSSNSIKPASSGPSTSTAPMKLRSGKTVRFKL